MTNVHKSSQVFISVVEVFLSDSLIESSSTKITTMLASIYEYLDGARVFSIDYAKGTSTKRLNTCADFRLKNVTI